jgi:gluconate 2-dehydrogenase alpha chain
MQLPQNSNYVGLALNLQTAKTIAAVFERLFPADETGPGAQDIGALTYLDQALAGAYRHLVETYRIGAGQLDEQASLRFGSTFCELHSAHQDELLRAGFEDRPAGLRTFLELCRTHLQEGLFADPVYGGNRDKAGWRWLGHPGVWLENSAEENLAIEPVTKGGVIQSLADVGPELARRQNQTPLVPRSAVAELPPWSEADVVLVGLGAMGGIIAPVFAEEGLKVVALEIGPWRTGRDYLPDELGAAYYCRANLGPKFEESAPTWRRNDGEPTIPATFSLGRMMNGVGGSVVHYGAWLRRFHPHHFRMASYVRDRWGADCLPENHTLADWPISYADLEPYFSELEHYVGVAGDETNPFLKRSKPLPMPPTRPFRLGQLFHEATSRLGLHPHPVAVGMNTVPYKGRPATEYTAWSNGFGSFGGDKWDPSLSSVPEALATGNLQVRLHCQVTQILTDGRGRAIGVAYVDQKGELQIQRARIVALCAYTFENLRLMFLSGDSNHSNGLGNNHQQLGRNFMTKMFCHVNGRFPGANFNRHTGPAAQGVVLDDFVSDQFDSFAHGFLGGATLGAEQQFLPIQISREALPAQVQGWGKPYKDHIRNWQQFGVIRIQPDTLSYRTNYLNLDPIRRDRSGLGRPVIRITYDMRENEHRLAAWMEAKAEEILREMGAVETWRGNRFTGVGSSHDLGGARMGLDPATSVVDPELRVHDTPGLYLFGGAAFPTCPGINPTLTLWAVCRRAAERLRDRLKKGEEP